MMTLTGSIKDSRRGEEALEELCRELVESVFRLGCLLGRPQLGAEVAQKANSRVRKSLRRLRERDRVERLLFRFAINASNLIARRRRPGMFLKGKSVSKEQFLVETDTNLFVSDAFFRLSQEERISILFAQAGASDKHIADFLATQKDAIGAVNSGIAGKSNR